MPGRGGSIFFFTRAVYSCPIVRSPNNTSYFSIALTRRVPITVVHTKAAESLAFAHPVSRETLYWVAAKVWISPGHMLLRMQKVKLSGFGISNLDGRACARDKTAARGGRSMGESSGVGCGLESGQKNERLTCSTRFLLPVRSHSAASVDGCHVTRMEANGIDSTDTDEGASGASDGGRGSCALYPHCSMEHPSEAHSS